MTLRVSLTARSAPIQSPVATRDRAPTLNRQAYRNARAAETGYAAKLRSLADHIADIVRHYFGSSDVAISEALNSFYVRDALQRYAQAIGPWAEAVSTAMLVDVERRDRGIWRQVGESMNRHLAQEIDSAPIGDRFRELMAQQVGLITSIPLDAAEDVHKMAIESVETGERPKDIATHIHGVTVSRANTIARTEVGRASTTFLQARAEFVGSEKYVWRTMGDGAVRHDHRILNGKTFDWGAPPVADQRTGARAHPGCIYNCRCFADPIIPDFIAS
jgi:SPP1 gp7 family putative phage head morphogenesis protein